MDWDGANSADLFVKSLGTGAVKQITSFTPAKPKDYAFAEEPRWSPDSTKLGMTLVGASNGEIAVLENFLHQERPVSPANAKGMVAPTSAGAGRAFALRQVSLAKFPIRGEQSVAATKHVGGDDGASPSEEGVSLRVGGRRFIAAAPRPHDGGADGAAPSEAQPFPRRAALRRRRRASPQFWVCLVFASLPGAAETTACPPGCPNADVCPICRFASSTTSRR